MNHHKHEVFLKGTHWCDSHHPGVQSLAKTLRRPGESHRETAVRMFHWVRDRIRYRVGLWNARASETLHIGQGCCTNKANLLVALLRSVGIPAGYCVMTVHGQAYLGPAVLPMFRGLISPTSTHVCCCVLLARKWVRCDPSDDIELFEKTGYFNYATTLVNWDGLNDGLLNLRRDHIFKDEWPMASIDHLFHKKPRALTRIPVRVGNCYIAFLRENEKRVTDIDRLQKRFIRWLRKNDPPLYAAFSVVLLCHRIIYGIAGRSDLERD